MNSTRLHETLQRKNKTLVGFLLAGYPDQERFFDAVRACSDSLDILEVGYPSYNPYGDGEVIQRAHAVVDTDAARKIEYWERLRTTTDKPIWLMAYCADFVDSGAYREFAERGVMDVIVVPDADSATIHRISEEMRPYGIDVMCFLNPGMSEEEMAEQLEDASLVYEQLYLGKTGGSDHTDSEYMDMLRFSQKYPNATRFAGFGLNSRAKIEAVLKNGFDGAVVGTELMRRLNKSFTTYTDFLSDIREAAT